MGIRRGTPLVLLVGTVVAVLAGCAAVPGGVPEKVHRAVADGTIDADSADQCARFVPDVAGQSQLVAAFPSTLAEADDIARGFDPSNDVAETAIDSYGPESKVALCVFTGHGWADVSSERFVLAFSGTPEVADAPGLPLNATGVVAAFD